MVYRQFSVRVVFRVFLLSILLGLFLYSLLVLQLIFSAIVLGILVIATLFELIRYVNKSNRELAGFLEAIKYHDFSNKYPEAGRGRELHKAFNLILLEYRRLKFEKELHARFLHTLVEQIPVGIMCIDDEERIILYNDAARSILGLKHISSLAVIERILPELHKKIQPSAPSYTEVLTLQQDGQKMEISLRSLTFTLDGKPHKIVTLQNIKGELEFYEVEAWQKLIRVLTHEIMNSVTPISSLSSTLLQLMNEKSNYDSNDLHDGMRAINSRSQGLLTFVEHYRQFTRIPKPVISVFPLQGLFRQLEKMYAGRAQENNVELHFQLQDQVQVEADEEQLGQVLINLINNALEASLHNPAPQVKVSGWMDNQKPVIEVKDNGPGIDPGHLDKIFVPFFTTREHGSGIGLSLSRQILLRNKATIAFRNQPGDGVAFIIRF